MRIKGKIVKVWFMRVFLFCSLPNAKVVVQHNILLARTLDQKLSRLYIRREDDCDAWELVSMHRRYMNG